MKKILIVAGARPNFMKIAPLLRSLKNTPNILNPLLIHTGQHYDFSMSDNFFSDLGIQIPDYNLEVGSGSHATQTALIMQKFEEICLREKPECVLVVGDVNSTIAAGLVAKKLNIYLAHIEAGLRSFDRTMPEEINRLATDAISDLFFTTEEEGTKNLIHEGHPADRVHFVGHVMIDNLFYQLDRITKGHLSHFCKMISVKLPKHYFCLTLHRPSNVDSKETLTSISNALSVIGNTAPILFPCHPRTMKHIQAFGLKDLFKTISDEDTVLDKGIYLMEPLGYNDFLYLWKGAVAVLTDSGGLQEETTALKVPCITLRENTERPVTVTIGTNEIVGTEKEKIIYFASKALNGEWKRGQIPPLWDGKASERIVEVLGTFLQ